MTKYNYILNAIMLVLAVTLIILAAKQITITQRLVQGLQGFEPVQLSETEQKQNDPDDFASEAVVEQHNNFSKPHSWQSMPLEADSPTVQTESVGYEEADRELQKILETGYLDEDNWQKIEAFLENNDSEQSVQLWEKLFSELEKGRLEIDVEKLLNN